MSVFHKVEIETPTVPSYVKSVSKLLPGSSVTFTEPAKFHVSELDTETLENICAAWRIKLFETAGKKIARSEHAGSR